MLTVFTPVYNRRHTMGRLYESLRRQTDYGFEWMVIDDGSTDGLEQDIHMWERENNLFPIRYRKTQNGGKHRAINLAAASEVCEYIFFVDSDDYLDLHAIECISGKLPPVSRDETLAGMSFPIYIYTDNRPAGTFPVSSGYMDAALNKAELGISGDICMVFKRDVLRKYPFPEYEGENFVSEAAAWDLTALDGYKFRFFNEKIYFAEYLKDGLTRSGLEKFVKNPKGWAAYLRTRKRCNNPNVFKAQYSFFACMHKKWDEGEICRLLELDREEYAEYETIWRQFNEKLSELLEQHRIASVALYGFGMNAQYFLIHLQEIGRDIVYGIDYKAQYINYEPIYSLDMDLPCVDCVFITPGNISEETINNIRKEIKRKLPGTLVWALHELDARIW